MKTILLNDQQLLANINATKNHFYSQYHAFYSSWFGGITKNPVLMLVPIDDHMVHRGDGVFEAVKVEQRAVYLLDQHLDRLWHSAEKISLNPIANRAETKEIILETLRVANQENAMIRIFLSRGPGGFGVNPYDSIHAQLYVVITDLKTPAEEKYTLGVTVGKSVVPCKENWMAQIKSCNYLQNVLMKKEAIDRQLEYVIGVDAENHIAEGYTENIIFVDAKGHLVHPPLNGILKGITMMRACELAADHGITVTERLIHLDELSDVREVMITGTSLDVLPVSRFEKHVYKPGPVAKQLRAWMKEDISKGRYRTEF